MMQWRGIGVGVLLGLLSLNACGSDSAGDSNNNAVATLPPLAKKDSYRVGFVQVWEESANPWRAANTASIQAEAAKRGYELVFETGSGYGASDEVARMNAVIAAKVDVIIIAPQDPTVLAPSIVAARRAGIPVFIEDRSIDNEIAIPGVDYVSYVGSDFLKEGATAAQWLVKHPPAAGVKILELEGTVGSSPAVDRKKGFDAEIAAHPEMRILDSESGNFDPDEGYATIKPMLVAHPEATAIFTHNDGMAVGVIKALKELGKEPGDVQIVSIDGAKVGIQAIKDGWIGAVAECNPRFGPVCFDTIEQYADGQTIPLQVKNVDRLFEMSTPADSAALEAYLQDEAF
ncbi:MAG: ABC transporter substrate-binding protein [Polyangiaceae bacterium]